MVDINYEDIKKLNATQMQELLNKLLCAECYCENISLSGIRTTLQDRAYVQDGGADGLVDIDENKKTPFFFYNKIIFQVKATYISSLKDEVAKKEVANRIKDGWGYVLFCNKQTSEGLNTANQENSFKKEVAKKLSIKEEDIKFKLYDHSKIKEWIDRYPSVQYWLSEKLGKVHHLFKSFNRWSDQRDMKTILYSNSRLDSSICNITNYIENNKIIRIEGQAGIGKTRQVFEAIKNCPSLSASILYVDNLENNTAELARYIDICIVNKTKIILIVDDCDAKSYCLIKDRILKEDNNITFVSMDYVCSKSDCKNCPLDSDIIYLEMLDDEVIADILRDYYKDISDEDLNYLVKICGNNPRMAEVIKQTSGNVLDFSHIIGEITLQKLHQKHNEKDNNLTKFLKVSSLFDYIKYSSDYNEQLIELAKLANIAEDDVLQYFNILKKDLRVIQARYEYHNVVPKILAFQMALNWFSDTLPEVQIKKISQLPEVMKQSLFNQISNLNNHPEVQYIAKELLVPFANAEILNTKFGSRCFCLLSQIVPDEAIKLLKKTFINYKKEDYSNIVDGRRNLISTLKIIAFHKNLFLDALEIMLNLAEAENETWGNNATGEFESFFKLYLSGATLPAIERLALIENVIEKETYAKKNICLDALLRALDFSHFSRASGPEVQGAVHLEDWQPKNGMEIQEYIEKIVEILKNIICDREDDLSKKAKKILSDKIRHLTIHGFVNLIEKVMIELINSDNEGWEDALLNINEIEKFEIKKNKLSKSTIDKIMNIKNALSFRNLKDEVFFYILKQQNWDIWDEVERKGVGHKYAAKLKNNQDVIFSLINDLNKSNNHNAFLLGAALVEELEEVIIGNIISQSIEVLKNINIKSSADASFLSGLCFGLQENNYGKKLDEYLDAWSIDDEICQIVILVSSSLKRNSKYYNKITNIVINKNLADFIYVCIPYIGSKDYENEYDDVKKLLEALIANKNKAGISKAINILHSIFFNNKTIPCELRKISADILFNNALFTNISYSNGQLEYEYNELWQEIYVTLEDKDKYNYLLSLMRELLNEDNRDGFIKDVAKIIIGDCLNKTDKNALKVVGDVASESDYNLAYLEIYLDMHCDDKKVSYFSNFTMEELKVFIEKDKRCVLLFARVIPLFDKEWNLSEYFRFILKEYSTDSDILHNLYTNIYNFSWTGRISNYYRKVINAISSFDDLSDDNIRKWKQSIISSFNERIEKDDKEDDLREWGLLNR